MHTKDSDRAGPPEELVVWCDPADEQRVKEAAEQASVPVQIAPFLRKTKGWALADPRGTQRVRQVLRIDDGLPRVLRRLYENGAAQ